jgi:hypothetical protein
MRITILVLFLSTGATALCQSAAPASPNAEKQWLILPGTAPPVRDFGKLPHDWHFTSIAPMQTTKTLVLPNQLGVQSGSGPQSRSQIDPKIIVHPPQLSIGEQPPGTQIAETLYPGLQLLPIEESKAKTEPIPTMWPNMKMEQIPIVWPKAELLPIESGSKAQPAGK